MRSFEALVGGAAEDAAREAARSATKKAGGRVGPGAEEEIQPFDPRAGETDWGSWFKYGALGLIAPPLVPIQMATDAAIEQAGLAPASSPIEQVLIQSAQATDPAWQAGSKAAEDVAKTVSDTAQAARTPWGKIAIGAGLVGVVAVGAAYVVRAFK